MEVSSWTDRLKSEFNDVDMMNNDFKNQYDIITVRSMANGKREH